MKKNHIPYIVFSLIMIALFVFNVFHPEKNENVSHKKTDKPKQSAEFEDNKKTPDTYVVKADGKQIFLYDNEQRIIQRLNIDFNNLREYDKNMLIEGIYFDNIEDVYLLIEDFSS